jgi:hypothetical protein
MLPTKSTQSVKSGLSSKRHRTSALLLKADELTGDFYGDGDPGRIRTCGLQIRKLTPYIDFTHILSAMLRLCCAPGASQRSPMSASKYDYGPHSAQARCLLCADCVDLIGNEQRPRKNRIQVARILNRCCASEPLLESILLTSPRQNVYQHNLCQKRTLRPVLSAR